MALMALMACGSPPEPEVVEAPAPSSGAEESRPRKTMEVEGLMGTIPERKILATLEPKLGKFQRCFFHGSADVEFIGGRVEFYFRVALDGHVEWVYLRDSSVGHLGTETCLLEEAKRARFPGPKGGGAAELAWGFELDPLDSVRAPVAWDEGRVAGSLTDGRAQLEGCGSGNFLITAYIAPGGEVMAAGASADSQDAAQAIPCLVDAVRAWSLPDPGSYPAKVSFELHSP